MTRVAASLSAVTLANVNARRRAIYFFNDSANACFIKYGAGGSSTDFTIRLAPGGFHEMAMPTYTGIVSGVWFGVLASGGMQVTEVTK